MLIKTRVTTYRNSQQKDSGGGGGLFEWCADVVVVGVVHVRVIV
jgi:hypothetical protein